MRCIKPRENINELAQVQLQTLNYQKHILTSPSEATQAAQQNVLKSSDSEMFEP